MSMSSVFDWYSENTDVKVNRALSVKKSIIDGVPSGYGLFVDLALIDLDPNAETLELLRIPRLATFSLETLLELIRDETQYSSKEKMEMLLARVKSAFAQFLEHEELKSSMNETTLLVFYFTFLTLVKDEFELPKTVKFYLENVLLKVEVDNGPRFYDQAMDLYGQYSTFAALREVIELLDDFFKTTVSHGVSVMLQLKRVYAAIASRCLEIPHEVDRDSDDFAVSTTLVPLLDFANHSNDLKNAHFDIDRQTQDVLLLLDLSQIPTKCSTFEVFISYSPNEDLLDFLYSYGFVPSSRNYAQLMSISFDRSYLKEQEAMPNVNIRLFCKWLRINPVVQLIRFHDHWYINDETEDFACFLLAFMESPDCECSSCWTYDPHCYLTFWYFQEHSDKPKEERKPISAYRNLITSLENDDSDLIDLPQLAWSMSFQGDDLNTHRGRLPKEDALEMAPFDNEKVFDRGIERFAKFFINYSKWRLDKLEKYGPHLSSHALQQLVESEKSVLLKVLHDPHLSYWSDQQEYESYESTLRPLLRRKQQEIAGQPVDEVLSLEALSLKEYRPEDYTDYLQEELDLYAHFV